MQPRAHLFGDPWTRKSKCQSTNSSVVIVLIKEDKHSLHAVGQQERVHGALAALMEVKCGRALWGHTLRQGEGEKARTLSMVARWR